jgi:hypothetical protein
VGAQQPAQLERSPGLGRAPGQPIISVDTKKKELVGNFKDRGATWSRAAAAVNPPACH